MCRLLPFGGVSRNVEGAGVCRAWCVVTVRTVEVVPVEWARE